jgi:hypothetical protein
LFCENYFLHLSGICFPLECVRTHHKEKRNDELNNILIMKSLTLPSKAYLSPGVTVTRLAMESVVCNGTNQGTGREDLGGMGGTPTWDPED